MTSGRYPEEVERSASLGCDSRPRDTMDVDYSAQKEPFIQLMFNLSPQVLTRIP